MKTIAGIPQAELEAAKIRITEKKCQAFDYMKQFASGTYNPKTSGYKSIEDALVTIILRVAKEIEKEMQTLEKKYPD